VPKSIEHLDLVWFQIGELELHAFAEEPLDDDSGRHFCLVVGDVEGIRRKLLASGYEPWDPDPIPGRPRFFCRDPFGNIIEFTTIEANYWEMEESQS
jgi:catechol 2,3-dioxygenase-like lactoylglutathione lyase family enzyme